MWKLPEDEVWNTLVMFPMRHWHYSSSCFEGAGQIAGTKPWGPHTKEAGLAISRDGGGSFRYSDEPHRESVLGIGEAGGNLSETSWVTPAPLRLGGRLLIYLNGQNTDEVGGMDPLSPGHRSLGGTVVAVTRDAGLAALVPPAGFGSQGTAITKPLLPPPKLSALTLNLDCRGRGYVQVGLAHANGTDIAGFELQRGMLMAGLNSPRATVFWITSGLEDGAEGKEGHQHHSSDLRGLQYDKVRQTRLP